MQLGNLKIIRTRIFAGLLLIVPLWVTFFVATLIVRALDRLVSPIMDKLGKVPFFAHALGTGQELVPWPIELALTILLALLMIYLLGLISTTYLVRKLYGLGERILLKIPLLKTIYSMTKQVMDVLASGQGSSFKELVAVEYPRTGCYALAFVTAETRHSDDPRPFVNVFLPTTPNPTSGFMLMLPREEVKNIKMSVEDGIKMLMSGGAVTPAVVQVGEFHGLPGPPLATLGVQIPQSSSAPSPQPE